MLQSCVSSVGGSIFRINFHKSLPELLSALHNIIKELMAEENIETDEQKAVVIQEDEHFEGEILTAEQHQILKRIRGKLIETSHYGVGGNKNTSKIDICWLRIGVIGAIKLKRCLASDIQHLHLNGAYIGSKGCKIISQARWEKLETLQLYQNEICQVGARHLSKAQWKNLTFLHLGINLLRLEGFRYLIRCHWIGLQQLYIYNNQLTPEVFGLYALSQWNELYNLHTEMTGLREDQSEKAKMIIKSRFAKASTICI